MRDLLLSGEFSQASRKELRAHQVKAIDLLRQSLGKGNRKTVIQMPTGAGKTVTAAEIILGAQAKGNRVVFTAPAVSLIEQTITAFEDQGVTDIGVMQANHPRTDAMARVQVATVQTLARRKLPSASLVIVDECHIRSSVVEQMMADRDDLYFVGLSATPWAKGMGLVWDDLVIPITIREMIGDGLLSEFTAFAPDIPDLSKVQVRGGEYVESALEQVMGGEKILGSVVATWLERAERRPTLCFCVNRAHASQVQQEFMRAGIAAAYVDGNTDSVEREVINRRFKGGEYSVICSVRTMTTGVDLPVSCIIDAAPTRSEILHVQKIGRGLRVNDGTEDCLILDHAGNSLRLGLVTDIHHDTLDRNAPSERVEGTLQREKQPKACTACQAVHLGRLCPVCGHETPLPKMDAAKGDLVQLRGKVKQPTSAEKQQFWSMAFALDLKRRKAGRLAKALYKSKFGVWPKGMQNVPLPPDAKFMDYEKSRRIAYSARMRKQEGK